VGEGTLLIRADANVSVGTGHVMRCLALAQAWQDSGGDAVFAVAEIPSAIEQRLAGEGFSIVRMPEPAGGAEDADATVRAAHECGAVWVVIDGDRFDVGFLQGVKAGRSRVLLFDDFGERESFPADLILNPNSNAIEEPYRKGGSVTPLLLGESYVMLRREFASWRGERILPEKASKVLVTLGGSDPDNLTPKIAEALGHLAGYEITVIAGPGYPYLRQLEQAGPPNVRVVFNAKNMRELMEQADLAVIAAGGTLWELLYMQCVTLSYARNPVQSKIVQELAEKGAVHNMGATIDFDGSALATTVNELGRSKKMRRQMTNLGRQVVDGKGASRVLQALKENGAGAVEMLPVSAAERGEFLQMAEQHFRDLNLDFVPKADWTESYFEGIQSNPDYFLRWIMADGQRAGFILFGFEKHRFLPRTTGNIFEVYVRPSHRRRGLARRCAQMAIDELEKRGPSKIQLEVVQGNPGATALWLSMGFRKVSERYILARAKK